MTSVGGRKVGIQAIPQPDSIQIPVGRASGTWYAPTPDDSNMHENHSFSRENVDFGIRQTWVWNKFLNSISLLVYKIGRLPCKSVERIAINIGNVYEKMFNIINY